MPAAANHYFFDGIKSMQCNHVDIFFAIKIGLSASQVFKARNQMSLKDSLEHPIP
jgi:hypothetical protein